MNRNNYFLKLDDGVTQTHILNHHIEKCPILVPKNIEEQREIGTVIQDMDKEIEQLAMQVDNSKDPVLVKVMLSYSKSALDSIQNVIPAIISVIDHFPHRPYEELHDELSSIRDYVPPIPNQ